MPSTHNNIVHVLGTAFYHFLLKMEPHFMGSSEPCKSLADWRTKAEPSSLSIGPAPGIKPVTFCSTSKQSANC